MSDLLTVSEASRMLGLPEPATRALIATGQLEPAPFMDEMAVRIPADNVREYQASHPRRLTLTEARRTIGDYSTLTVPPRSTVVREPWADVIPDDPLAPARALVICAIFGLGILIGAALAWVVL